MISKALTNSYIQFVTFNPWKTLCNWIAFYQNSFVIWPGSLYHLIRCDSGRLANEAFTSNPIVSSEQYLSSLKITNCINHDEFVSVNNALKKIKEEEETKKNQKFRKYCGIYCINMVDISKKTYERNGVNTR